MNLRDHDDECIHGERLSHPVTGKSGVPVGDIACPGGAAIDIDYEAAWEMGKWGLGTLEDAVDTVDAALGGGT